jgi:hypothetical protein
VSGYEAAPATLLLATHCCACGRPLVDADSVEAGMGPDCRAKHGYGVPQGEPDFSAAMRALAALEPDGVPVAWTVELGARELANKLVHRVATNRDDLAGRTALCIAVSCLGFTTLAGRLLSRSNGVTVTEEGGMLTVRAPFNPTFNEAVRRVPGQRWVAEAKARRVPATSRRQLWEALKASFPAGTPVVGSRGAVSL